MENGKHDDSALIDKVGSAIVVTHFSLSPQRLYNWRMRGIPVAKRIAFAKLCAENGVSTPEGFFDAFGEAA